jgi:hypothetical protein
LCPSAEPEPSAGAVIIILVDSNILNMSEFTLQMLVGTTSASRSDGAGDNKIVGAFGEGGSDLSCRQYTGHYIVIIGFSTFRQAFMYLDPAKPSGMRE